MLKLKSNFKFMYFILNLKNILLYLFYTLHKCSFLIEIIYNENIKHFEKNSLLLNLTIFMKEWENHII